MEKKKLEQFLSKITIFFIQTLFCLIDFASIIIGPQVLKVSVWLLWSLSF